MNDAPGAAPAAPRVGAVAATRPSAMLLARLVLCSPEPQLLWLRFDRLPAAKFGLHFPQRLSYRPNMSTPLIATLCAVVALVALIAWSFLNVLLAAVVMVTVMALELVLVLVSAVTSAGGS